MAPATASPGRPSPGSAPASTPPGRTAPPRGRETGDRSARAGRGDGGGAPCAGRSARPLGAPPPGTVRSRGPPDRARAGRGGRFGPCRQTHVRPGGPLGRPRASIDPESDPTAWDGWKRLERHGRAGGQRPVRGDLNGDGPTPGVPAGPRNPPVQKRAEPVAGRRDGLLAPDGSARCEHARLMGLGPPVYAGKERGGGVDRMNTF